MLISFQMPLNGSHSDHHYSYYSKQRLMQWHSPQLHYSYIDYQKDIQRYSKTLNLVLSIMT